MFLKFNKLKKIFLRDQDPLPWYKFVQFCKRVGTFDQNNLFLFSNDFQVMPKFRWDWLLFWDSMLRNLDPKLYTSRDKERLLGILHNLWNKGVITRNKKIDCKIILKFELLLFPQIRKKDSNIPWSWIWALDLQPKSASDVFCGFRISEKEKRNCKTSFCNYNKV